MRKRNYVKTGRGTRTARRKKWFLSAAGAFFAVYLLASSVFGEMGLVKYFRMRAQYQDLKAEITDLKRDNVQLFTEVDMLKSDPACIERIAREKLGLARPGEIVYYYKADQ